MFAVCRTDKVSGNEDALSADKEKKLILRRYFLSIFIVYLGFHNKKILFING